MAESHYMNGASGWQAQKAWADDHINEVNRVLRKVIGRIVEIVESDPEQDREHAIDYEIKVPSGTVACRIGRAECCSHRDLTVTALRPRGSTPEIQKILDGDVRWYLYAWAHEGDFVDWMFVDLDVVRDELILQRALKAGHRRKHPDGSTFAFVPFSELERHGAIVASTLSESGAQKSSSNPGDPLSA